MQGNVHRLPNQQSPVTFETINPASWGEERPPPREWMVEGAIGKGQVCLLAGDGGIGKCQGSGTPILMYDGRVIPIEHIRNGDALMGPDSKPRFVRGTTSGWGELYRVTPVKGDPYIVNGHHVLSLKWTPRTGKVRPTHPINISVHDYLALPKEERRHLMGWRADSIQWPERPVDLPPYLIGLWLGDGSHTDSAITTPDREVVEAMQDYAEDSGLWLSHVARRGEADTYRIRGKGGSVNLNPFKEALRGYGVYTEKAIPQAYLINSERVRLDVLAGLIDTDGHLESGCYEIAQKSATIANQILFLARSLGLAAYSKIKMSKAQTHDDLRPYHRVHISGDIDRIPVRVQRRKAAPRLQKKRVLVTGIKVEPIGEGTYYGFEVDGDHLYLMGDFTVTHNSLVAQQLCACAALGRPWLGLGCQPGRSLFFSSEDDDKELRHRQYDICRSMGVSMGDVGEAGMEIACRVGLDNTLSRLDRKDWKMSVTDLFVRMVERCREYGIQYVVIDTATQTFAGNQNDEQQVVQFCNQLRRLATLIQGCVIITKHPSVAGRALGTGESGSVSWNNSVRSRMYLHRNKDDQLILAMMKANYGPATLKIPVEWQRGCFVRTPDPTPSYTPYRD